MSTIQIIVAIFTPSLRKFMIIYRTGRMISKNYAFSQTHYKPRIFQTRLMTNKDFVLQSNPDLATVKIATNLDLATKSRMTNFLLIKNRQNSNILGKF